MALSIVTNTASLNAQRNLNQTNSNLSSSLEKLSSGLRVNKAADDVASMAIGSRLNAELTALKTVATNAGQAVSLIQIAEGTYSRTNDMLVRMKSLTAQAANGTLSDTERQLLDVEFQALVSEIDRVAKDTTFNGQTVVASEQNFTQGAGTANYTVSFSGISAVNGAVQDITSVDNGTDRDFTVTFGGVAYSTALGGGSGALDEATYLTGDLVNSATTVVLGNATDDNKIVLTINAGQSVAAGAIDLDIDIDGTGQNSFDFRVGTGSNAAEDIISADINAITESQLGLTALSIGNAQQADSSSIVVDRAINYLIDARANVGASQNRIETARNNLATTIENTEAAKSSYLDADIASEITQFTSQQILLQSGISTLAQANQVPQNLLSLFQ